VWLEPYPDAQLGLDADLLGPDARYEQRESLELAFTATLQHLPPRQRAVLILRDVLGFSARETAEVLETTPVSVDSALQRAHKTVDQRVPAQTQQATLRSLGDTALRDVVDRFTDAWESNDVEAVVAMLVASHRTASTSSPSGTPGSRRSLPSSPPKPSRASGCPSESHPEAAANPLELSRDGYNPDAGGQYPRTGVARQYGSSNRARACRPARRGGRDLRLIVNHGAQPEGGSEHMNITATRFATKTRTWLLIAGLTGLLIAIGGVIGGGALYIFVALAVLMNVVGYWFSDKLALKASRAQPVEPGTLPELEGIVQDLAQRARVPVPRLFLIPSEQPNAFATGRNPKHAAVAVTQGLLQYLPPDEVKGVLAHEFAHIKNRDILVSSIAAMVAGAIAAIANILQFSLLFGSDDEDSGALGLVGMLATIILAPLAATLLQLAVSRQREYLADATGAELLGRAAPLADALETLERGAQAAPMSVNPATASLYAVNPLPRRGVATLFMTHPPLGERIRRLRVLDGDSSVRLAA
jgi:heat shock protein HtpX